MATEFRQKTCLKCKSNHDEEGSLCQMCIAAELRRQAKREPAPDNYWVECLIEREGDTIAHVGNIPYRFSHNKLGHCVCEVVNPGHYKQFTQKMGRFYRAYDPDKDYPEIVAEAERLEAEQKETEPGEAEKPKTENPDSSDDWPDPPQPTPDSTPAPAGDQIKEQADDGTGTDNGQAAAKAGGDNAADDRTGGGKRSGQGGRSGAGKAQV